MTFSFLMMGAIAALSTTYLLELLLLYYFEMSNYYSLLLSNFQIVHWSYHIFWSSSLVLWVDLYIFHLTLHYPYLLWLLCPNSYILSLLDLYLTQSNLSSSCAQGCKNCRPLLTSLECSLEHKCQVLSIEKAKLYLDKTYSMFFDWSLMFKLMNHHFL
jgi:hypothetical protein